MNSLLGKLFISVSLGFLSGLFLVFSFETHFSVFSFFKKTFSVSMKLGETITCLGFENVSLYGDVPMQLACTQWLWWES